MSAGIVINLAEKNRIAEVCRIMREGYVEKLLKGTIYESDRFEKYFIERMRMGDLFLIGFDEKNNDNILGFAQILQTEKSIHLNHLVVKPSVRCRGLGDLLLQDVILRAHANGRPVTLDVDSRNIGAVRFYERANFKIERRTSVALIPRESGFMPLRLVDNCEDYKKFGFCYIDCQFPTCRIKIGIVGKQTLRLPVSNIPSDFDWKGFVEWAKWADVYVFGEMCGDSKTHVQEEWEVFRMRR